MSFLNPRTDIVFKKVFGNAAHTDILINFLNSVLERTEGQRIVKVVITDPYNHPETIHSKSSIVDISCTDQKDAHYIVEMQIINRNDFLERCQYYVATALARQVQKGDEYITIDPVIFIGILCFDLLESPEYFSHHLMLNAKTHEHALKHAEFHFIEIKKFNKKLHELVTDCDKWVYFLKNANDLETVPAELKKPAAVQKAFTILEQSNWTNKELDAYERAMDLSREKFVYTDTAYKEGMQEKARETALKLLKLNILDVVTIAQTTGLTVAEVEKLKKH